MEGTASHDGRWDVHVSGSIYYQRITAMIQSSWRTAKGSASKAKPPETVVVNSDPSELPGNLAVGGGSLRGFYGQGL